MALNIRRIIPAGFVANLGSRLYSAFGPRPRDIEWVIGQDGTLFVVQDRDMLVG
ncbi:MAG: hypothetical protein WC890_01640 [Candidatus Margulisiibacteriota bacterium]